MAPTSTLAILVGVLTLANAAPWPQNIPRCSVECIYNRERQLNYLSLETYTYWYSGKSEVQLRDVEDGVSKTDWSAEIDFTWLSHCDVAITFKNTKIDGNAGLPETRLLERYPMVMALSDGRVQHVCAHPDDDTWAVNWKKGIASIFQLSLPTRSDVTSGLEFVEVDTVGKCPTKYEVHKDRNHMTIKKEKIHKRCKDRYPTPFESPAAWLKAPFPMDESKTECDIDLINGVYKTIVCKDKSIIRPSYGSYKYVEASQESTLRYKGISSDMPEPVTNLRGPFIHKSLLYDHDTPKKDPSQIPQLEESLRELCEKTKLSVDEASAPLMAKVLQFLRRIPGSAFRDILIKIKTGRICSEHQRLEALFLDAIAFVHVPDAVEIMVMELVSGRTTEGRVTLYAAALHLTSRPTIHTITALKPLFETSLPLDNVKLAAGSMIHLYCHHNPHCEDEAPVKQIAEILAGQVEQKCKPYESEQTLNKLITPLKVLGNMGVMTPEITTILSDCSQKAVGNNIQVAALEAFRNAKCQTQTTRKLFSFAIDQSKATEVRIASYLAVIKCANKFDLNDLISNISQQGNTQVRDFILSHLLNLQKSSSPRKENLRYKLTDTVLPLNFTSDFMKYSHNTDMAYYIEALGLGAEYESDVIFTPGYFIPRSMNLNFTSALGGIPINLGEFGIRTENFDYIIKILFGPGGYLKKSSLGKVMNFFEEKFTGYDTNTEPDARLRRSTEASLVSHFLTKLYGRDENTGQKADVHVRFNGQEITYGSWAGDLGNFNIDYFIKSLVNAFEESIDQMADMHINTARTAQMRLDYSLPTINGIPLKLQLEGTALLGLKMGSQLNSLGGAESANVVEIYPGLSMQLDGFVGFDSHLVRTGVKMENLIASENGLTLSLKIRNKKDIQMEVKLPEVMNLLSIRGETYLTKVTKGHQGTKIIPESVRNVRIHQNSCTSGLGEVLGLELCYNFNVPNIFRSIGLPLGEPSMVKLSLRKTDSTMRSYLLRGSLQDNEGGKTLKLKIEAPGASLPRGAESTLMYKRSQGNNIFSASIESPKLHSSLWANFIVQDEYKSLETFGKWNANGIQLVGGFKMELKTESTDQEKGLELNMYNSASRQFAPDSKVLEVRFTEKMDGEQKNVDFIARTMNSLKHFIDFSFQVGGDLKHDQAMGLIVLERLRTLELQCTAGGVILTSYVRKSAEYRYKSLFRITHLNAVIVDLHATHYTEGSTGQELQIKTSAEGNFWGSSYKYALELALTRMKNGGKIVTIRQQDGKKVVDIEVVSSYSEEVYNARFIVDVPEYMQAIKIESKLTKQEEKYMLEAAFRHGSQLLLQIDGPVSSAMTIESVKLTADITILLLSGRPLFISTSIESASKKQAIKLIIKNQQELLLSFDSLFKVDRTQMWTIGLNVNFPVFFDGSSEVVIMDKMVQLSSNTVFYPKSSSPRRAKVTGGIDLENMEVRAETAWDVDRDPQKKLSAEVKLIPVSESTEHWRMSGKATYRRQDYGISLEVLGSDIHPWRRETQLTIVEPSGKTANLSVGLKIQRDPRYRDFGCFFAYKDFQDKNYKFSKNVLLDETVGEGSFHIKSLSRYDAPDNQVTTVNVDLISMDGWLSHIMSFKVGVGAPSLHKPMSAELMLGYGHKKATIVISSEIDEPQDIFKVQVLPDPNLVIKEFLIRLDISAAIKLLETIHMLVDFNSEARAHPPSEMLQAHAYQIKFERTTPSKHSLEIKLPSRSMEGQLDCPPGECRLKFYPDKERTSSKYEIEAITSRSDRTREGREIGWYGRISHPSLSRDLKASIQYKIEGGRMIGTGSVVIDIFPDEADKITGTLTARYLTKDSLWVEATLSARGLKMDPHVDASFSIAPHIRSFDLFYRKNVGSIEPYFSAAGKIDLSHGNEAAVAFTFEFDKRPVIEFSGSLSPEEGTQCTGVGMQAIARIASIGHYNLRSKLCKPGFIEISANKEGKLDVFMIRMGYKDPRDAELSFIVDDRDTLQRLPILMAKINLASPNLVNVDFAKASDQLERVKNLAHEEWERIASTLPSWVSEMIDFLKTGAHLQDGQFPPSEFFALIKEAKRELKAIYHELVRDIRNNPMLAKIHPYVRLVEASLGKLEEKLRHIRSGMNRAFQENFQELEDALLNVAVKILRMIEDQQVPEVLQWIISGIEQIPVVQSFEQMLEDFLQRYPEDLEGLQQIVAKTISKLEEDIDDIRDDVSKIPAIQRQVNWFMGNYNHIMGLQMDEILSKILSNLLILSVDTAGQHFRMSIPIYRPIYSIAQALQFSIPKPVSMVKGLIWLFYSFEPTTLDSLIWEANALDIKRAKDLLPPRNGTAMIVEGTEIITFDGSHRRAPISDCMLLLALYESNLLMMQFPQTTEPPRIILESEYFKFVIEPDHRVIVNEKEMTTPQETYGDVSISKTSEVIIVKSSYMAIHLYNRNRVISVEITGWAFGHTAGILGTYDGEADNDWIMSSGAKASSLQELVNSWQVDKQCQTPAVTHYDQATVPELRVFQCHALLDVRTTCSSVIDPSPFIKICYIIKDVRNAELAHYAKCATKGISSPLFP